MFRTFQANVVLEQGGRDEEGMCRFRRVGVRMVGVGRVGAF